MLNEFKRSMWNDGYSKEQPWLNYYNSYERMHCCFGDDGGDGGGGEGAAGDEAFNTSSKAARDASIEQSIGMSADQAEQVSDAVDRAQQEGIAAQSKDSSIKDSDITEQMQNVAEGGNRAAASGYTGDELGQIADANIDTAFFDDRNTLGIGAGSTSGYGSFADPFAESGVGQTSFGSYINDLKDAGAFAAQNVGITGLISAVARTAAALGKDKKDVNAQEISMVTGGQNYGGYRSDQSPIAGPTTSPFDDEFFGPAMIDPTGIGAAYAAQPPEDPVAVQRDYADAILGVRETRGGPSIDLTNALLDVGYREEAQKADKAAKEQQEAFETGGKRDPLEVAYQARQDMSYGQGDPGANFTDLQYSLGADFMPGPGQPGYGGAALGGSGMTDAELQEAFAQEAFDLGIGPSSPGYAGAALGGMTDAELQAGYAQEARDMSSARQPDVLGLTTEVDSAENIFKEIIKKPEEKAEVVPKTPMEKYFAERGTPAIPSSFQEYRSYLPPIGPAANADYRRTLALGTPRYQEPSGPNRSIATLAAAYGMTYDEAAKRFAPPSVPKPPLDKPILFAASGGGLRSLMEYS